MEQLTKIGRLLYGIGIIAMGVHQLILQDFRMEVMPPAPLWAHQVSLFPILIGVVLILVGLLISGVKVKAVSTKSVCLYLGFGFLLIAVFLQLPYILFVGTNPLSRLDVWFTVCQSLAYGGGAFVMAGSFAETGRNSFEFFLSKLIPCGRIFFCVLMIVFGLSHFVFATFVSTMVPAWIGAPMFWTYFVGVALIGAGIAIIFKIWMRPVAFLLAFMLLLFFLFFHVQDAIANPVVGGGNEIVRAIIALMFTGIAIMIGVNARNQSTESK